MEEVKDPLVDDDLLPFITEPPMIWRDLFTFVLFIPMFREANHDLTSVISCSISS